MWSSPSGERANRSAAGSRASAATPRLAAAGPPLLRRWRRRLRRAEPAAARGGDPAAALVTLRERLGLTRFELDIFVLCAAMELDTSIAGLCARVQGRTRSRAYPTFALALSLFEQPDWEVLSPERGCAIGGWSRSTSRAGSR